MPEELTPITRNETFLAAAGGQSTDLEPITRKEMLLAKAAGKTAPEVEPITREEWFISQIKKSLPRKAVNFLSKDALVTLAYTKQEFLALEEMPDLPKVPGLVGKGWSKSLADAKAYLQTNDELDISPTYTTEDGSATIKVVTDDEPGQSFYPGINAQQRGKQGVSTSLAGGYTLSNGRYLSGFGNKWAIGSSQGYLINWLPTTDSGEFPVYDMSKPWRVHIKVKCSAQTSKSQVLFGSNQGYANYPSVELRPSNDSDNKLFWAGWSTRGGNNWENGLDIFKDEMPFSADTWYDIDYIWNKETTPLGGTTATLVVTDGTRTVTKTKVLSQFYQVDQRTGIRVQIGDIACSADHTADNCIFDLANCWWEQDGEILWGNRTDNPTLPPVAIPGVVGDMANGLACLVDGRYITQISVSGNAAGKYTPKTAENEYPVYDMSKPWHIHVKVKCSALISSYGQTIIGNSIDYYDAPSFAFQDSGNTALFWAGWSTNGTSWEQNLNILKSELSFTANQWYILDYLWDGETATFTATDGTTTVTKTVTSTTPFYQASSGYYSIGSVAGNQDIIAKNCTFDLADCYYEQDGEILWGNKL